MGSLGAFGWVAMVTVLNNSDIGNDTQFGCSPAFSQSMKLRSGRIRSATSLPYTTTLLCSHCAHPFRWKENGLYEGQVRAAATP